MRKSIILLCLLLSAARLSAQNSVQRVLDAIEKNNASLQSARSNADALTLEARTGNSLENPEVEYVRNWSRGPEQTVEGELNVTQSFDFPTAYAARNKAARLKAEVYGHELNARRQELLLEGKTLCIRIVALRRQVALLESRVENARRVAAAYASRLEAGEANVIEKNRSDVELASVQSELNDSRMELASALVQLDAMTGGEPFADTDFPDAEPVMPLESMIAEYEERAPALLALYSGTRGAQAELKESRAGSLPSFTVGYHYEHAGKVERFNGVVMGMSLPLWGNRYNVKRAKAHAAYTENLLREARVDNRAALSELYAKYEVLSRTLSDYRAMSINCNEAMGLINKALDAGALNLVEYLTEVEALYSVEEQRIAVERDFHLTVAGINAILL